MSISAEDKIREEWDLLKSSGLLSQIGCTAGPQKIRNKGAKNSYNLFKWNAIMRGPKNSPYNGYMFKFEITFPSDYPNKRPTVICKDKNMYHMNISTSGSVCVSSITSDEGWGRAQDISTVLLSIFIIFSKPNPDSPHRGEIAKLYKEDKKKYEEKVKEECAKFALKIPE